ncbi:unnamed protein product [Malus baccata var. baccata]
MVDSWCNAVKEHGKLSTSHSLMKRTMFLWASIHLCLEVKDEKAMKMAPGTRKALLSLVRPGYQERIPSMVPHSPSLSLDFFTIVLLVFVYIVGFAEQNHPKI